MFSLEHNAGIGRISLEVLNGLRARGHEVTVMQDKKYSLASYFKYTAYDIAKNLPAGQDCYCAMGPLEGAWLPRKNSVTVFLDLIPVTHPHQAGANQNGNLINKLFIPRYVKFMAHLASENTKLVAISEQTKQEVMSTFKVCEDRITVINPGVRQDLIPKSMSVREPFRIGYLGQLDHRKRVDLLINAFLDSGINAELVIAGTGPDEKRLKAYARCSPKIKFQGFVPDNELSNWFGAIDVLVHPSACEGWGMTIVEAFACRKPVIVMEDSY